MTPADLDAIEARAKAASIHVGLIADEQCIALVAEVRRLRAALEESEAARHARAGRDYLDWVKAHQK